MTRGGGLAAAGQDEILQWRQLAVEIVQRFLQASDRGLADRLVSGHAQFTTEVEQAVLDVGQAAAHRCR